ncbi:MAG: hypothetical protein LBG22_00185 [Treponema sp.]|jgi:tetratricopeptide (TPR) repeat protein|nr:hypothetical protein [Treponema sp.]
MYRKNPSLLFILILSAGQMLSALDVNIRPRAFTFIPLGDYNMSHYSVGGGGELLLDADISSILTNPLGLGHSAGLVSSITYLPLGSGAEGNIQLYSLGGNLGLFYYPLSRLLTRGEFALGYYGGIVGNSSSSSLWFQGDLELGFRFTPSFSISAHGGFRQYHNRYGNEALNGFFTGLGVQIVLETRASASGLAVSVKQNEAVFPVFSSLYQRNAVAVLNIRNEESAEIRNVRVSFRAGEYTTGEYPCGTLAMIPKNRHCELPLYADFAPALLNFTENGRITGELVIRYTLLGRERVSVSSISLRVYSRNSFPWRDSAALAAFVSPTDPDILEFQKAVTGLARSSRWNGLNQNMQFAMYLYNALICAGVKSVNTQGELIKNNELSLVQFPIQTMAYRTGDAVDMGLLYGALLEAAGISAGIIPLEGEFIVFFSLDSSEEEASRFFTNMERLLIIDNEAWLPLACGAFNEGFTNSWIKAAEKLSTILASGESPGLYRFRGAWINYPPASLPPQNLRFEQPADEAVRAAAETDIMRYIAAELGPKISETRTQLASDPGGRLYNQLGNLYNWSGMMAEAKNSYERAASMGYINAMNNLGNIYLQEKNLDAAENWFARVLSMDEENDTALRGLEQLRLRRGE